MSVPTRRLPQELYGALYVGEQKAKMIAPPNATATVEDILLNPDRYQKLVGTAGQNLKGFLDALRKRQRKIRSFVDKPQHFFVARQFSHGADERYLNQSHLTYGTMQRIVYLGGSILILKTIELPTEEEFRDLFLWGWVDPDGWVMSDAVLCLALHRQNLTLYEKA